MVNTSIPASRYPEFFHPLPLLALLVLVLNDHWLKGSNVLPHELTGKLSDFAGLLYFPLFVTASLRWSGTLVSSLVPTWERRIARCLRLTAGKLIVSCVLTGAGFAALKLLRPFAELYLEALAVLGQKAAVTPDPSDLWALFSLPVAFWIGMRALTLRECHPFAPMELRRGTGRHSSVV